MENDKSRSVSHTFSHHIYRVSTLVSMITSSTKLIDMYDIWHVDHDYIYLDQKNKEDRISEVYIIIYMIVFSS